MWKVICATLVIFITGVVTGGLLVIYANHVSQKGRRQVIRETNRQPANPTNPFAAANPRDPNRFPNPLPMPGRARLGVNLEFLQRLDAEVNLTAGQRERIEAIINEGQQRNKEAWERVAPEIRKENSETLRRIREALLPDQLTRFEELMKQNRPTGRRTEEPQSPGGRPRDPRRSAPFREPTESPQPVPQGNP